MAKKRRVRQHIIADLSVNHVERFALHCGFSVERVQHDYGIDLMLFTYDENGEIEPGQIYLQLKATDHPSMLQDQLALAFPVKRTDLELWLDEPMPYILVLYDAQLDIAYWLYIQAYFARLPGFNLVDAGDIIVVHFQKANVVSDAALTRFAHYKNGVLRQLKGMGASITVSSTTRVITYVDLDRFLTRIGFTADRSRAHALLFRCVVPDVLIVLPLRHADDIVDDAHLLAVRRHILENGLLDEASFERLLWDTKPTAASP